MEEDVDVAGGVDASDGLCGTYGERSLIRMLLPVDRDGEGSTLGSDAPCIEKVTDGSGIQCGTHHHDAQRACLTYFSEECECEITL